MIQKLKRRFVLMTMGLLLITGICIFSVLYFMMVHSTVSAQQTTLRTIIESGGSCIRGENTPGRTNPEPKKPDADQGEIKHPAKPQDTEKDGGFLREFGLGGEPELKNAAAILYDSTGNITRIISSLKEETTPRSETEPALLQLIAAGTQEGTVTLSGVSYRYKNESGEDGGILALVSRTAELNTLRRLRRSALFTGAGGMALLFCISLLLARWATDPIREAWEKQRRFVADASHELRTPLTVITANLDAAVAEPEATVGSQKKWLDHIRSETERMKRLTEALLCLARMDAEKADEKNRQSTVPHSVFNLSDLAEGVCLSFEPACYEADKTYSVDIEPELYLDGSEDELRQLILILLDNALKNTPQGGCIHFSLKGEGRILTLACQNTGSIPEGELEKIFERFYRSDSSRSRGTGGFGLGLAIAKDIAGRQGGTIRAENTRDHRALFTVRLPRADKSKKGNAFS